MSYAVGERHISPSLTMVTAIQQESHQNNRVVNPLVSQPPRQVNHLEHRRSRPQENQHQFHLIHLRHFNLLVYRPLNRPLSRQEHPQFVQRASHPVSRSLPLPVLRPYSHLYVLQRYLRVHLLAPRLNPLVNPLFNLRRNQPVVHPPFRRISRQLNPLVWLLIMLHSVSIIPSSLFSK